jgi:putative ABC transport system permease protein
MSEAIVVAIRLVAFVVIFIIMAVMVNTMAMTARERIGEYAVFKTLGYGGWHIAGMIFGESLIISMTGCALGIAGTFPAAAATGAELSIFFPVFKVSDTTLYLDIGAALTIGIISGIFPTWRSINIRIADGLRRIG